MIRKIFLAALLLSWISCSSPDNKKSAEQPESTGLSQLIKANPDDPELYFERAKVYYQHEAFNAAIDDLNRAIELDASKPKYYHSLSDVYLDSYKSKKAIETLEKAHELFPDDIKTLLKMSEDYVILLDNESAMVCVDKIMNLDNQNAEGYFMMGMIFRNIGDKERAINAFQSAIEIEPELYDAWILIGQLHEDLGNEVAIQYFNSAIDLDPTNINGWHSKAFYLQNQDQIPEALEIYRKINKIDKQFEEAYLNAGLLYLSLDSIPQAYDQFNILVSVSPISYLGFYYRGIANEMMNKSSQAKEDYEVCLRINPSFEKAKKALASIGKEL